MRLYRWQASRSSVADFYVECFFCFLSLLPIFWDALKNSIGVEVI